MGVRIFCAKFLAKAFRASLLALLGLAGTVQAADTQSLEAIRKAVSDHLESAFADSGADRVEINVGRLDPRLKLADCPLALDLKANNPGRDGGQLTVQVRCPGERPWAIYVPAQVDLYRPVAVATRHLQRGDEVSAGDIEMVSTNTGALRQGYLGHAEAVIGQQLRRPLAEGEHFRSSILEHPLAVHRGDKVSLEARSGGIAVSTRGTAMGNGRVGEQIRVKNDRSERVIQGEIIAPGHVQAVF